MSIKLTRFNSHLFTEWSSPIFPHSVNYACVFFSLFHPIWAICIRLTIRHLLLSNFILVPVLRISYDSIIVYWTFMSDLWIYKHIFVKGLCEWWSFCKWIKISILSLICSHLQLVYSSCWLIPTQNPLYFHLPILTVERNGIKRKSLYTSCIQFHHDLNRDKQIQRQTKSRC